MLTLLTGLALGAAPTFSGTPEDVALAEKVWTAAAGCAGTEAKATASVAIERTLMTDERHSGITHFDRGGTLARIEVQPNAPVANVAYHVAAAWYPQGAPALRAGRAEVLAMCVADRLPDAIPYIQDDRFDPRHLSSLREWTDETELDDPTTYANTSGARRLFRALTSVLDPQVLMSGELVDWAELDALLTEAGDPAQPAVALLAAAAADQATGLTDPDHDAMVTLHEQLVGTDPNRWDTDDDGWWDGAPAGVRTEHAVPVPRDRTPICLPRVSSTDKKTPVVLQGDMRGLNLHAMPQSAWKTTTTEGLNVTTLRYSGGYAIVPTPEDGKLEPNPACIYRAGITFLAGAAVTGEDLENLEAFSGALDDAAAALRQKLGPAKFRIYAVVNSEPHLSRTIVNNVVPRVNVPSAAFKKALGDEGRRRELAYQLVAMHWLTGHGAGAEHAGSAVALAEELLDGKSTVYTSAFRGEIKKIARTVSKCEGGWNDVINDRCMRRVD